MDSSCGNLISLSDSGVSAANSSQSQLNVSLGLFSVADEENRDRKKKNRLNSSRTALPDFGKAPDTGIGVLIDLEGEIEVPISQAILTQAEVDDTFGVFSKAGTEQSKKRKCKKGNDIPEENAGTNEKLIESFNSGNESKHVKNKEVEVEETEEHLEALEEVAIKEVELDQEKHVVSDDLDRPKSRQKSGGARNRKAEVDGPNSSEESYGSDQPTVVMDDTDENSRLSICDEGSGILDMKLNHHSKSNLSTGTGSDSELLDINNLSSFSLPDVDMDEDDYLNHIKQKDMAELAVSSTSIVNQIKLEMLEDEFDANKKEPLDIDGICLRSSTTNKNRLSSSSCVSAPADSRRSRWSTTSTVSNVSDETAISTTSSKVSRISGIMASPIRASYPVPSKYMPTPKSSYLTRDKLNDSLYSPSKTRIFLQTGSPRGSPSRVPIPVRKSISAETLHFHHQSPLRNEGTGSHMLFSTPGPANRRNRYSFKYENQNDSLVGSRYSTTQKEVTTTDNELWTRRRNARVSFATTSSNSSINTLTSQSPPKVEQESRISLLANQIQHVNINDDTIVHPILKGDIGHTNTGIQPMKATAVVQPAVAAVAVNTPGRHSLANNATTGRRRFIPPIAASSPKGSVTAPSPARPATNQTTPSRNRYSVSARSSGYGQQKQNLNMTANGVKPLTSPNKMMMDGPSATKPIVKPAAMPRSLKSGLAALSAKSKIASSTMGKSTTQTMPKSGTMSLRRPTTGLPTFNKENVARPGLRTGLPSRPLQ